MRHETAPLISVMVNFLEGPYALLCLLRQYIEPSPARSMKAIMPHSDMVGTETG